jgi:outer membrane protein TolC
MQCLQRWPWTGFLCLVFIAGCQSLRTGTALNDTPHADTEATADSEARPRRHQRRNTDSLIEPLPVVGGGKPIPISLDTVLQMAQDHNGQVRLARLKVQEAFTDQEWANKHWLPDISVGMAYWRHEGGIQDFQGNLLNTSYGGAFGGLEMRGQYDWKEVLVRRVEAERKLWQQKGELSKLTSENLLEATTTYIDLMAAQTGVVISKETEARLNELLTQTMALAKVDPGLNVEVTRINAELSAQSVLTVKLREAAKAATARLAYLLGLDPCCDLVTVEPQLVPIKLVDPTLPVQAFVDQALTQGPGVRELEGLLRIVAAARNSNYGWQHWMPAIDLCMQEGAFGAGPGNQLDWANRFDLTVHLRWNLNEFVYAKYKRQQADMHIQQVQLSFQDLRLKLTLGVQESRDAILGCTDQMRLAERHIKFAEEAYRQSDQRLKQNIKGRSPSEVLLALRSLGGARLEYLQAVRDLDKAHLRLHALVGIHS